MKYIIIFGLFLQSLCQCSDPIPIWIDLDTGNDDAFALLIAVKSIKLKLVGVSTSYGNSNVDKTTMNTVKLLSFLNKTDIPVIKGYSDPIKRKRLEITVHGDSGMFGSEQLEEKFSKIEDTEQIYENIKQQAESNGKLVIGIFGSSTNIARLLMNHDDINQYVKEILFMGGAIEFGNITPCAEFNVYCDALATSNLIQLANQYNIDVIMAPLEVTHLGHIEDWFIQLMKQKSTPLAVWFTNLAYQYQQQCKKLGYKNSIHDGMALAYYLFPQLYPKQYLNVAIETESELCYGRTIVDKYFKTGKNSNVYVLTDMLDKSKFFDFILDLLD